MKRPKSNTHTPALLKLSRRDRRKHKRALALFLFTALSLAASHFLSSPPPSQAQATASADLVINEVYGGGGNGGATFNDDFVEIYNRGSSTVSLNGWSLQYNNATGGGTWDKLALSGPVGPGQYYLVQIPTSGLVGANLPTANISGTLGGATGIAASAGKLALVTDNVALTGTCPQTDAQTTRIRDFVGYGTTANCSETANAPIPDEDTSISRNSVGNDTNNNSTDFTQTTPPTPRPLTSTVDAVSQACDFDGAGLPRSFSWSHTTSTNTSRVLIVSVSTYVSLLPQGGLPPPRVSGVTYNGVAMTRLDDLLALSPDGNSAVEMFILKLPASGTHNVQVTLNAGVNYAVAGAISINDVNQTSSTRPFNRSSGSTSPASITVTSATNELVLDTIATRFEAGVLTVGASPQIQRWNGTACDGPPPPNEPNLVLNSVGAGSTKPGAASVTTTWTEQTDQPWAMGAVSILPLSPTQVELASFDATATAGGVQLKWETGREVDNLGFNVYREENGGRVRLNPTLIAGSALIAGAGTPLTAGNSYSWSDAQGKAGSVYWLEDIDLDGTRNMHGPVAASAGSAAPQEQARLLSQLSETNGKAGSQVREYPAVAPSTNVVSAAAAVAPLSSYQLASRAGVKIAVNRAGWYRVTQPELAAAGLGASIDPRKLQLYAEGLEQAVKLVTPSGAWDANAYLEFYGTGLDIPSTDRRTYWLVNGSTAGKRVGALNSPAANSSVARSFPHTVEVRERLLYFSALRNGDGENFFGRVLSSSPQQYVLNVHHFDRNTAPQPALEISLQGVSLQAHQIKVLVNGTAVGTINYDGMENSTTRLTVPHSLLREGNNNVKLITQNGATDVSLVDTVRLTYSHFYKAHGNRLFFTSKGAQTIRAEGFANANIRVLDVTSPGEPFEILPQVGPQAGALYSATFKAAAGETRSFIAFTDDLSESPVETKANQPSKWSTAPHWADLVVITHGDFRAAVEPLARLRRSQGRLTLVVDVEDIYDEFSYGAHSPFALRDFLMMTKERWSRAPRWVMLVGDGSYDPRNYQGRGQFDFVPTKMVDTKQMETAMDDWFADFDSDAVPEMAMGRLPVQTVQQAEQVVAKIIGYSPANNAGRGVLLVADRAGADGYDFAADSDALKTYIPGTINVQSINRTTESADTIRSQIIDGLNQGQILANWVGHGSFERWTGDGVLRIADVPALANNGKPAFFVTMTCMNGYYHSNTGDSLSEALMKVENGGAVAVWASSGITLPTGQAEINRKLYEHLFGSTPVTLGEAVQRAKAATSDIDVRRTWILFGDPLMRLR